MLSKQIRKRLGLVMIFVCSSVTVVNYLMWEEHGRRTLVQWTDISNSVLNVKQTMLINIEANGLKDRKPNPDATQPPRNASHSSLIIAVNETSIATYQQEEIKPQESHLHHSKDKNESVVQEGIVAIQKMVTTVSPAYQTQTQTRQVDNRPIITMFTSFTYRQEKEYIYRNTIVNRALLKKYVKPILYYNKDDNNYTNPLIAYAKAYGWDVYPVPRTSPGNMPVLRAMYLHAQEVSNTTFYAFSNADILFDFWLIKTLRAVQRNLDKFSKVLIVGKRTNTEFPIGTYVDTLHDVQVWKSKGTLFLGYAIDYFITTYMGFPWNNIPDFVIGRVEYDRWLISHALRNRIPTISATGTLTALHQTDNEGNYAGHHNRTEMNINIRLAGRRFDFVLGNTACTHFATRWRQQDEVQLFHRNGFYQNLDCRYKFRKFSVDEQWFKDWPLL